MSGCPNSSLLVTDSNDRKKKKRGEAVLDSTLSQTLSFAFKGSGFGMIGYGGGGKRKKKSEGDVRSSPANRRPDLETFAPRVRQSKTERERGRGRKGQRRHAHGRCCAFSILGRNDSGISLIVAVFREKGEEREKGGGEGGDVFQRELLL